MQSSRKILVFHEIICAHIEYDDIHANIFYIFEYFLIYFLDKGNICTQDSFMQTSSKQSYNFFSSSFLSDEYYYTRNLKWRSSSMEAVFFLKMALESFKKIETKILDVDHYVI
jgi:hypothetical protein